MRRGEHSYEEVIIEPTCTAPGSIKKVCSACGAHEPGSETPLPAAGHDYKYETREPTCTAEGFRIVNCNACDLWETDNYTNMKPHNYGEWRTEQVATCKEAGSKVRMCSVCSTMEQQEIPKLAHTETTVAGVAATCTTTGLTEGKVCSVCNEEIVAQQEIPVLGHSFSDWIIDKEPTYEEEGKKSRVCTRCNEEEEENIPKLTKDEVEITTTYPVREIDNNKYLMLDKSCLLEEFKKKITSNSNITIKDKKGNLLNKNSKVPTGANVITDEDNKIQYIVVQKGDIDSDGEITWNDIIWANAIRINGKENDKATFLATDIDENNKIDFQDIIYLNAKRINGTQQ